MDFSFEVSFEGKNYYYLSQASLFNEELVIVYTRNVSSLKTEKKSTRTDQYDIRSVTVGCFRERWG